jgi:hypothetical protein
VSRIKGNRINKEISVIRLDGGIDLKKVILVVLVLVALMGLSAAYDYSHYYKGNEKIETNTSFNYEQSVQGNGYFMTYMYAKQGNLAFKNYAHGSGTIDNSAILTTTRLNRTNHPVDDSWNDFVQNCIQFKEDNSMVYAPMRIAVGNGFYAANPIDYSSLLKEQTWVKNYAAATSIKHEIEYAHAIDKELDIVAKEYWNHTYDPTLEGIATTQFHVLEDVTDGKIHFGVLQGSQTRVGSIYSGTGANSISNFMGLNGNDVLAPTGRDGYAWKHPAIEVDEDYWGTYHVEKNITLTVPYKNVETADDWLPCCFGGWDTMRYYDKKSYGASTKGVFDCTCFKTHDAAEFTEPSEIKAYPN